GPCAGGGVYFPAITDFIFITQATSYMFITGPHVIKTGTHEEVTKKALGGPGKHNKTNGVAPFFARDEAQCLEVLGTVLSFLPSNNAEPPPRKATGDSPSGAVPEIEKVIPQNPNKPYDARDVIKPLVDDGFFFEVHERFAPNIVCAFARIDGRPVGIVANQP